MSNGDQNLPLSVLGTFQYPGAQAVVSTYGQPHFGSWTSGEAAEGYWFLVLDLTTLNEVVAVTSQDYENVPPDVAKFVGDPTKLLIFATLALSFGGVPQGDLFATLKSLGAGALLDRAEQILAQLGTGYLDNFSYILVTVMDVGPTQGFEEFSYSYAAIETLELMPVTVDDQTTYAPISLD